MKMGKKSVHDGDNRHGIQRPTMKEVFDDYQ